MSEHGAIFQVHGVLKKPYVQAEQSWTTEKKKDKKITDIVNSETHTQPLVALSSGFYCTTNAVGACGEVSICD